MDITFKFAIGQQVSNKLGVAGVITAASVGRGGQLGYWLEYLDTTGVIRETYALEPELSA